MFSQATFKSNPIFQSIVILVDYILWKYHFMIVWYLLNTTLYERKEQSRVNWTAWISFVFSY